MAHSAASITAIDIAARFEYDRLIVIHYTSESSPPATLLRCRREGVRM